MPAPCPPWCLGSSDCKPTDDDSTRTRYHVGEETSIRLGEPDVTACVAVSRDDEPDEAAGEPYVYLCGGGPHGREQDDWAEDLTPAAAVQLGQALIAAGMEAAGLARQAVVK